MLKKLSLAALVAMGSMSVASATPLTDAIKGVSLNGFMRIRYYYHQDKTNTATTDYNRWRTNAKLVFGIPVAENMKIVWRVHAQTNVLDKASSNVSTAGTTGLGDSLFYLNYANNGLIANVGVVPLGSLPFASSDPYTTAHGAGVVAMYNAGNGLTVAGGWVDHIFNANGTVDQGNLNLPISAATNNGAKDVYTAGAIYANDAFGSAQVWDYHITDAVKNAFIVMTNLNFLKDYGVGIKADFATSKLDDKSLGLTNVSNHNYFNIALNANVSGINGEVGYASTNDKAGVIATSDYAVIGQVPAELRYNVANLTDVDVWYAKAGYNINEKTNVWASYVSINQSNGKNAGTINATKNVDSNEFDVGGGYKFNKKFGVSAYYANLNYNGDGNNLGNPDQQEVRAQFIYSF
ncbi:MULTISPECIES: major outer membrane protein [unclassified Lebetimonas]|uniref:major outer membrane protein n=1 Tax=unclassified Lebetimonas TaxID=2648158 RepID=UPI00046317A6|nr:MULTISPECIES: major outer membrane protein [unclassified Lebetimonas]